MSKKSGAGSVHESYRDNTITKVSSDRSFGIVFAVVAAGFGAWWLWRGLLERGGVAMAVAFVLLGIAYLRPNILSGPNRLWLRLGDALHHVMNPLVMGAIFFIVFTPIGVVMRLFGFNPLRTKLDPEADSYWIDRDPAGPAPETMKDQF